MNAEYAQSLFAAVWRARNQGNFEDVLKMLAHYNIDTQYPFQAEVIAGLITAVKNRQLIDFGRYGLVQGRELVPIEAQLLLGAMGEDAEKVLSAVAKGKRIVVTLDLVLE